MSYELHQRRVERESSALRSQYADDALIGAVLALDVSIRRAAWTVLGMFQPSRSDGSSMSRSTPGSSTS